MTQDPPKGPLCEMCDHCSCLLAYCHNQKFGNTVTGKVKEYIRNTDKDISREDLKSVFISSYTETIEGSPYSEVMNCNIKDNQYPPLCIWNGSFPHCEEALTLQNNQINRTVMNIRKGER